MSASSDSTEHLDDALALIDSAEAALQRLQMLAPSPACGAALDALAGQRRQLQQARMAAQPPPRPCRVRGAALFDP